MNMNPDRFTNQKPDQFDLANSSKFSNHQTARAYAVPVVYIHYPDLGFITVSYIVQSSQLAARVLINDLLTY